MLRAMQLDIGNNIQLLQSGDSNPKFRKDDATETTLSQSAFAHVLQVLNGTNTQTMDRKPYPDPECIPFPG